jgi:excisionase family DNA binding protein
MLSTSQAATELGVSERTLRRYIATGQIDFHRLPGGHYRIPHDAITQFWIEHDEKLARRPRRQRPAVARIADRAGRSRGDPGRTVATRRPRLGDERQAPVYDLSPARLAELRSRFS